MFNQSPAEGRVLLRKRTGTQCNIHVCIAEATEKGGVGCAVGTLGLKKCLVFTCGDRRTVVFASNHFIIKNTGH